MTKIIVDGHEIDVIEYFGDKHPQGGLTSFIHWYKGQRLIKTGSWIKNSTSFLQNKRRRLAGMGLALCLSLHSTTGEVMCPSHPATVPLSFIRPRSINRSGSKEILCGI